MFIHNNVWQISYDSEEGCADFILTRAGRDIVFEVGFGHKDGKQVSKTLKTRKDSFGVIISSDRLGINKEKTVVTVPLEMFLLM